MFPAFRSPRRLAALVVLAFLPAAYADEKPPEQVTEVKLSDDSTLKLKMLDSGVEIQIKYGKLTIPFADIRKIEVGHHVTEEMGKQIDRAVSDLGSPQFRTREDATALLTGLKDKAYPALKRAANTGDAEVVKRAEEIMEKIKGLVPEAKLLVPEFDTITTNDSKFTGKITTQQLKAKSASLGDMTLKFADLAALTTGPTIDERELANAVPDPGSMGQYQNQIGKTIIFKVTGATGATLWGTEMYTLDSGLATAAVHMGVLKVGQTGYVKVTILGPSVNFVGSTRNGVTSNPYQTYPGAFKVHAKAPGT